MMGRIEGEEFEALTPEDRTATFLTVQEKALRQQEQYIELLNDVRTNKYHRVTIEQLLDTL